MGDVQPSRVSGPDPSKHLSSFLTVYSSLSCIGTLKPLTMSAPEHGVPCEDQRWRYIEKWSPYPNFDPQPVQRGLVFNSVCRLMSICAEIPKLLHPLDNPMRPGEVQKHALAIQRRLREWQRDLAEPLRQRSIMVPAHVEMQYVFFPFLIPSLFPLSPFR